MIECDLTEYKPDPDKGEYLSYRLIPKVVREGKDKREWFRSTHRMMLDAGFSPLSYKHTLEDAMERAEFLVENGFDVVVQSNIGISLSVW